MNPADRLNQLLDSAGLPQLSPSEGQAFEEYLSLLVKWNAKLNLTAIRDVEAILRRHFLECIFCSRQLPLGIRTLLDFGSGGGFPGIPIAICRPEIQVTLGESQNKKASFLRETIRSLRLDARVEQGRAEDLRIVFDAVVLRAVDKMDQVIPLASERVGAEGYLILMAGANDQTRFHEKAPDILWKSPVPIPGSDQGCILFGRKAG